MNELGIIAIGRNEGERLRRCLVSVIGRGYTVVYVDSGSTDGSPEMARGLGADVVELDPARPFSVPRARNEGFERLCEINPEVRFVQFVDGDCEVVDGWLEIGLRTLKQRTDAAFVTGRRRERERERTIYNRLADLEWEMPAGEIKVCHGDILIRAHAFRQVGGFNAMVYVGEDTDLCVRLRKQGWILLCIDVDMTLHDMAMTQFKQWWRRSVRSGYGYAEGALLHGAPPERHYVREVRSILFWGVVLPIIAIGLAWPSHGLSLILLAGYLVLALRIYRYGRGRGWSAADAWLFAAACIMAKFPLAIGMAKYAIVRLACKPRPLIEYKGPAQTERAKVELK
jgi:GT2 family glycosyltransferase